ncbi:uncharacterized protein [Branchiostoma lanceolatum]|uniref:uncharacterized protein n=1 Tax=Branchiostoma lanceolatum TaxID=7740 RepID=UPI003453DFDA
MLFSWHRVIIVTRYHIPRFVESGSSGAQTESTVRSEESRGASREDQPDQDDSRLDTLEEMIEKQQKQINELETGNKLLEVRVDLQADKIKNLERDRDFLQDIKDEIMDLAQDVGDLKKDKDNLKNTVDSQNEDIVALQKELAGLADCCSGGSGDDVSFLPLENSKRFIGDRRGVVPK